MSFLPIKKPKTQLRVETVAETEVLHRRDRVADLEPTLQDIDEVIIRLNSVAWARQTRKANTAEEA